MYVAAFLDSAKVANVVEMTADDIPPVEETHPELVIQGEISAIDKAYRYGIDEMSPADKRRYDELRRRLEAIQLEQNRQSP